MRINKYIASAGICSRRKADELIEQRRVKVNGAVLREPGFDVSEGDLVLVDGKPVTGSERFVYYALNKPAGYVTTTSD
ncbi:MAG: rRNA pseudouridine synthase, partial [Firmicutes bacterium]|nr:rRNA pseudouridine synthase [Bacillota bacterium]